MGKSRPRKRGHSHIIVCKLQPEYTFENFVNCVSGRFKKTCECISLKSQGTKSRKMTDRDTQIIYKKIK